MRRGRPAAAPRHRARPPEERSLTEPRFVGAFARADVPLDPPLPEIAALGRSNVGKSSLVNALAGRRIARISATPGKTRAMNVYVLGAQRTEQFPPLHWKELLPAPCSFYCLDLPGYGYARASKAERTALGRLVRHALERPRLAGVLWLLDIRRHPSLEDRAIQEVLAAGATRVLAALTKSDKLPRGQRRRRERELGEALGLDADQLIATSARTGEGIGELREAVEALVAEATE